MTNIKRSRMNREERREQILESALEVFIENGYNKSTTQGIADAAAISEVTLFRYNHSAISLVFLCDNANLQSSTGIKI